MPLSSFTDYVNATTNATVSPVDSIVNIARARSHMLPIMFGHRPVRGGSMSAIERKAPKIQDYVLFNASAGAATEAGPGQEIQFVNSQNMTRMTGEWKKIHTQITIEDEEINGAEPASATPEQLVPIYKNVWAAKELGELQDFVNVCDTALWRNPADNTAMESDGGVYVRSIPHFINELTNGLYGTLTTVQTISPTQYSSWVNPVSRYNASDLTIDDGTGLPDILNEMGDKLRYRPLMVAGQDLDKGTKTEYDENDDPRRQVILTTDLGIKNYRRAAVQTNQNWGPGAGLDLGMRSASFNGHPVIQISALETATIYPTGAAGSISTSVYANEMGTATNTGAAATATYVGPRYWFLDMNNLTVFIRGGQEGMTRGKLERLTSRGRPTSQVRVSTFYWSTWCRDRRRAGGIVAPL